MSALTFEVVDALVEPYAAQPTMALRLHVGETTGTPVHAVALRAQLKIEPQRRRYDAAEEGRLYELFGATPQWGDSLRPFLWTHLSAMVPGFAGETMSTRVRGWRPPAACGWTWCARTPRPASTSCPSAL